VSTPPDVLKYVHEEPALLEPVTPDGNPDARRRNDRPELPDDPSVLLDDPFDTNDVYRGYLAGTHHADDAVGLTTLEPSETYVAPLLETLDGSWWGRCTDRDVVEALNDQEAQRVLRAPTRTELLVAADPPVPPERITAVAGRAPRRAAGALASLLDDARAVFFPEPTRDGYDWSFFSAAPMRDRLVTALRNRPVEGVRRFVLPHRTARSESKFYFDTWQPTASPPPDYVEEV